MSEALYRRWRPKKFSQVVGQDQVVQTLRNAVDLKKVSHAYLFCGPRGTGKTSTARILAKAVNCISPDGGDPDNECEVCVSINEGRAIDLIEIDAASNRGIDDIRSLRDRVYFAPGVGPYRVYIIDEVHMLTEQAFNALLKTLEEPPEHAIFILATTEVYKLPLTVISRCQRFDFRRISVEAISDQLTLLCAGEEVEVSSLALGFIARASSGSLRDAENILERAIVSYGSPIGDDQVSGLLGLGTDEKALELVKCILSGSVSGGIAVINGVVGEGNDTNQFHRGIIDCLRGLLLIKSGVYSSLGYTEDVISRMRDLSGSASIEDLAHVLKSFSDSEVRKDDLSALDLELALFESILYRGVEGVSEKTKLVDVEFTGHGTSDRSESDSASDVSDAISNKSVVSSTDSENVGRSLNASTSEDSMNSAAEGSAHFVDREEQWREVLRLLSRHRGKRFNLGALLRDCKDREVGDGVITLKFLHRSHMERMEEELSNPQSRKVLQDAFVKLIDGEYEIKVSVIDGEKDKFLQKPSQKSHLVRAALAIGARVVSEKEKDDESENV